MLVDCESECLQFMYLKKGQCLQEVKQFVKAISARILQNVQVIKLESILEHKKI